MLAICRGPVEAARFSVALPQPAGHVLALLHTTAPDLVRCEVVSPAFNPAGVRWLGAIPRKDSDSARRIALTSRESDQRITSVEAEQPTAGIAERRLLPRTALLPLRGERMFGVNERAKLEHGSLEFTLRCNPGNRSAGVVVALGRPSEGTALAIELDATGDDGFHAQLIGDDDEAQAHGQPLASLDGRRSARLAMPAASKVSLVISCPNAGGALRLNRGMVTSARSHLLERPAAWVWNASRWRDQQEELLVSAQRLGLGTLFISVEIGAAGVTEPGRLADFVARAKGLVIEIVAVEGDPAMVTPAGRTAAVHRARALAAYQAAAPLSARLSGVQYDIEPYILDSFAADPASVWTAWSATLTALAAAWGGPVEAVVPYWILASPGGEAALTSLAPALRHITIMAYRTEPAAIIAAAEPVLVWAGTHKLKVSVALEAGALEDERRTTFVPASSGELEVVPLGTVSAVLLFDSPRPGAPGRTFRLSHSIRIDQSRVSFSGDFAAVAQVAAGISADLAAWPSIHGFAFHGLAELDPHEAGSTKREERLP